MNKTWRQIIKSILFLAGAFTFAFLLAEAVHETGHYLTHRWYGNDSIRVHLDPFGGSRMIDDRYLPETGMIITSAAGPLFSLVLSIGSFLILLKIRKPALLPLLIWGPTAMIQEGVNLSLGLFSRNSDAQWIVQSGLPAFLILMIGIALLIAGLIGIALLLPLAGIDSKSPFGCTLLIILAGMCSLLIIRLAGTLFTSPDTLIENLIPLGFSGILALVVTTLQRTITRHQTTHYLGWNLVVSNFALGAGMFLCQIFLFN